MSAQNFNPVQAGTGAVTGERPDYLGNSPGSTVVPDSQKMVTMKTEIPTEAFTGIKRALIDKGNKNPTDRDILQIYWRLHK